MHTTEHEDTPIAQFLAACCILHKNASVSINALHHAYATWARGADARQFSRREFSRAIMSSGDFQRRRTINGWRIYGVDRRLSFTASMRVLITGPCGCGKTTLARKIEEIYATEGDFRSIEIVDLDQTPAATPRSSRYGAGIKPLDVLVETERDEWEGMRVTISGPGACGKSWLAMRLRAISSDSGRPFTVDTVLT